MKQSSLLALTALLAGCASAPLPMEPGTYVDWDKGRIEVVEVLQSFHLADYHQIVVLPISSRWVPLPQDNTRQPVETTLANAQQVFTDGIQRGLRGRESVAVEPGTKSALGAPGFLFVRLRFLEINPGSKAARSLTSGVFGGTEVTISGDLIDSATGKTLVRFQGHQDRSKLGVSSRYTVVLAENERQFGRSIGVLLGAFKR